jgi:hypothetical protein
MALRIIPLEDVFVTALNVAQVYSILLVYRMFLPNRSGKVDQNSFWSTITLSHNEMDFSQTPSHSAR